MKNNLFKYIILLFYFLSVNANSQDQFNFDVTEIEILENGNKIIGKNKGTVSSDTGVTIGADEFRYDKNQNILKAIGNVRIRDKINNYLIFSEEAIYEKNKELISTIKNSKGINLEDNISINAIKFNYNISSKIISAFENVFIEDKNRNYNLNSDFVEYSIKEQKIITEGNSKFLNLNDKSNLEASSFNYDIKNNIVSAFENVFIEDKNRNYNLNSDFVEYSIKEQKIITEGNSKFLNLNDKSNLEASSLKYNIKKNIIIAEKEVEYENTKKNYQITSDSITYFKNKGKIFSKGSTSAKIHSKYEFISKDVTYLENTMELSSQKKTILMDDENFYSLSNFKYYIKNETLKGENILINTNHKTPHSDKLYFSSAILDLKKKNFIAKDTILNFHKNIFDENKNDPRIKGVSSSKRGNITTINKGIFTSCQKNDNCPPWVIQAKKIEHDKNKKQINYEDALLKIHNVPVMYFPKFFHPDPTVKRQSGILKPVLNNSNILGSSITIPYFYVITNDSDLTITPTLFDTDSQMLQNEYRKIGKDYAFKTNFGHTKGYKSNKFNKKKNFSYLFSNLEYNLNLSNFQSSKLTFNFEKVNNDTFLKIFDTTLLENSTSLKPSDLDNLTSELKFEFENENYTLNTGMSVYENLKLSNNDRYQYIFPYYYFNKNILTEFNKGSFNIKSSGSNEVNNTNQVKSKIINDLEFASLKYISNNGLENTFNFNLKNMNTIGKNTSDYKSSPQIELASIFEFKSKLPLEKTTAKYQNFLTPKASFRFNPSDMKNHKNSTRTINTDNIFSINRMGISDSFEANKSLTLGIDYKKENLEDINKYFEFKLATVFRDDEENFIPEKTTLNRKMSNIFGSIENNFSENINFNYNFAIDNDLETFEHNDISTTISVNNLITTFNYVKERGDMGDENYVSNSSKYSINEKNYFTFNARRNRKLNLTEYYDLVYQYKNDCLTAGIKYKKTYYEDRDLKPTEDIFFTVTLFPLTTYEHKIDK